MADSRQKVTGFRDGRPVYRKINGAKSYSERKSFGERDFDGKRDSRRDGKRDFDRSDRKPYGDRKSFGERDFDGKRDSRRDGKRDFDRSDRKPYGDRKSFGERDFDGKRDGKGNVKRDFDRSDRKPFGERDFDGRRDGRGNGKRDFDRSKRDFYSERNFDCSDRRPYGEREFGGKNDEKRNLGRSDRKDYDGRKSFSEHRDFDRKRDNRFFEGKKDDRFDREKDAFESSILFGVEDDAEENGEQGETPSDIIMGRNPVKEAIKSGRSIDRILVTKEHDGSLGEIVGLARDLNLVIREVDRSKLDELCMPFGHNGKPGNHQGIVAEIPGVEYSELSDILEYAESRNEKPFIILLDGIEDPHNLGSIIRSAECAGAHGVVITKRRCASVTAAVVKTSAGAAEHMRCARVVNLGNAIDMLKERGVWVAGADMDGKPMYDVDMKGAFALVIGSEGDGLSHLVKEKCDFLVSIPLHGKIGSLNAAVAGAIVMFEKNRQDAVR